jgi:arsenate reductase-like glutaredoxin family protein
MSADIIIYHNPACGTSRNALAMIRNAGIDRMWWTISKPRPRARC